MKKRSHLPHSFAKFLPVLSLFLLFLLVFIYFRDKKTPEEDTLHKLYEEYRTYAEQVYDPSKTYIPAFEPPEPGTYKLPKIKKISDHSLINSEGKRVSLYNLKEDRIAIVSFIYTNCPEKYGCPLSNFIMSQLYKVISSDPQLKGRVSLITISFDPERDTPQVMYKYRKWLSADGNWFFLTAQSGDEIKPVLKDFGQRVQKLYTEDGRWTGVYRHVLKIFLMDESNYVRNIYSTGMVSVKLILSDIKTLLLEDAQPDISHH